MQKNIKITLLSSLYQASSIGTQSIGLLINKTNDEKFKEKLISYLAQYENIKADTISLLASEDEMPKETKKVSVWMGVQINTLIDNSSSHMAEMLIQGSTMGIIEIVKLKNNNNDMEIKLRKLTDKFLVLQQKIIEDMKQYLY